MPDFAQWQARLAQPGATLSAIRERCPLIHNITNRVAMDLVANLLLAVGASPVMAEAPEEVEDLVDLADAVAINIGDFTNARRASAQLAAARANSRTKPWSLDPVAVGATAFRAETAARLMAFKPDVVRGNASEILALGGAKGSAGRGTDSCDSTQAALPVARALAQRSGTVVVASGARDLVTDGEAVVFLDNGHPIMTRVTAVGCALTALTSACLAVEAKPMVAAVHALAILGVAGDLAAARMTGPGSFRVQLLDRLYDLAPEDLDALVRLEVLSGETTTP